MGRPAHAAELLAAQVVYLLTLTWAGRTWRYATQPLVVPSDDGDLQFQGGLADRVYEFELVFGSDQVKGNSASFALVLPGVDVATLVAQGHSLTRARGELSMLVVGNPFEERMPLLAGDLADPSYSRTNATVSFSLRDDVRDDAALIPDPATALSEESFAHVSQEPRQDEYGMVYPFVFGLPGHAAVTDIFGNTKIIVGTKGTPVLAFDGSELGVAAGHRVVSAQGTDTLTVLYNATLETSSVATRVFASKDAAGRQYTGVDWSGLGWSADDEVWVQAWDVLDGTYPSRNGAILDRAGELLTTMLRQSTVPVDLGRCYAVEPVLNRLRVAGYIDDPVPPSEWVRDNLLPILPCSLVRGPDGLYPVLWRLDARSVDCTERLVAGRDLVAISDLVEHTTGLANRMTVRFSPDDGEPKAHVTITGDIEGYDPDVLRTLPGAYARRAYLGMRRSDGSGRPLVREESLQTDILYDNQQAITVCREQLRAKAAPAARISYVASLRRAWMRAGQVVMLTDPDHGIEAGTIARVERVRLSLQAVELDILIVRDGLSQRHSSTALSVVGQQRGTGMVAAAEATQPAFFLGFWHANNLARQGVPVGGVALEEVTGSGEDDLLADAAGDVVAFDGREFWQAYSSEAVAGLALSMTLSADPKTVLIVYQPPADFDTGASALTWSLTTDLGTATVTDNSPQDGLYVVAIRLGAALASITVTRLFAGFEVGNIGRAVIDHDGSTNAQILVDAVGAPATSSDFLTVAFAAWSTDVNVDHVVAAYEV